MSWLNLDNKMVEDINKGEYDYQEFEIKSEILKVVVEKTYIYKTDNGATAFQMEFKTENDRIVFNTEYVASGDEKDNRSYYIDKKGQKRPLPGVVNVTKFFKACGLDIAKVEPRRSSLEIFGKETKIKYFADVIGKQLYIANQAYEDDYSGEVKIRTQVIDYISLEDKDLDAKLVKLTARFEKTPVKLLKKKKEPQGGDTEKAKDAISGW